MDLFTEAGAFAWISLALFSAGLFVVVRGRVPAPAAATALAVAIVACGLVGDGLGQRLVDRAAREAPELETRVAILSAGTRETSSNLVVSGLLALALLGTGAAVGLARRGS